MFTKINSNIFLLLSASIFFTIAIIFNNEIEKPKFDIDKQKTAVNLNSNFVQFLSMGNKRIFSNLLWIQTLLEGDTSHYVKNSDSNWMYLRFLTISKLDPKFYENYYFGGMYLSIIKNDLQGAADLFELGLKIYNDDYKLNYYAGFNYYYEMGNYKKGFNLLKKIEFHPKAPPGLKFIISKLRYETTKNYDVALAFLENNFILAKDESLKKKITMDIYSLKADRDLSCLNSNEKNCSQVDAFGKPYIQDQQGKWLSKTKYKSYKIFRQQN